MRKCFYLHGFNALILALLQEHLVSAASGGLRHRQRRQSSSSSNITTSYRIVGGQDVPAGKYRFMADLEKGCGASLVAPDMLLSAAHCENLAETSEFAYVGSHLLQQGVKRRIVDVFPHPQYSEFSGAYDYMLIQLDQPVNEDGIEPVRLNGDMSIPGMIELRKQTQRGRDRRRESDTRKKDDNTVHIGELLTVVGFGVTNEGDSILSETLQEVNVAYVPHETCQDWYNDEILDETTMFCAGFERGGKDSCQGDSGAPILNNDGVQVGIVSWGQGCARPKSPGVYARVSAALPWINEMLCSRSRQPPEDICVAPESAILNAIERGRDKHTIQIDMKMDANPNEVAWILVNTDIGSVIDYMTYGSARVPYEEMNLKFENMIQGNYTFMVTDVTGDGICCSSGAGYVIISELATDGSSSLIWAENGSFGAKAVKSFELKAATDGTR